MDIYKYSNGIFPFKLWVVINGNHEKLSKAFIYFKEKTPYVHEDHGAIESEPLTAYTSKLVMDTKTNEIGVIVALGNCEITAGYMAHEACHVAGILYDYIGELEIPIQSESHAYFIQWIVECISNSIENGK